MEPFPFSAEHIVSILAHPERWTLPPAVRSNALLVRFQSSPTPKGGRYLKDRAMSHLVEVFQSSPTPKGGRYCKDRQGKQRAMMVSILAHPERWTLLRSYALRQR